MTVRNRYLATHILPWTYIFNQFVNHFLDFFDDGDYSGEGEEGISNRTLRWNLGRVVSELVAKNPGAALWEQHARVLLDDASWEDQDDLR